MRKEFDNRPTEYLLPTPVEVGSSEQMFFFSGFVVESDGLYLDIDYDGAGRFRGMVIRTSVNDSYYYKYVNHLLWTGEPHYANEPAEYEERLYDPEEIGLGHKRLSLEQISVFAGLVNQMVKEKGLENVAQGDIFGDKEVRDILGLDLNGAFDYVPVKKNRGQLKPEFA